MLLFYLLSLFAESPSPRQAQPLGEELGQADSQPVTANVEQNQNDFWIRIILFSDAVECGT